MFNSQTQQFTLVLSEQQLSVLNVAFALAPYGQVAPLIANINKQIQLQLAPKEEKAE